MTTRIQNETNAAISHVVPTARAGFEALNRRKPMLAAKERMKHKGAEILSAEAGPRRAGKWACPGASGREWSNPHSSARLNVPKTAFAHLRPHRFFQTELGTSMERGRNHRVTKTQSRERRDSGVRLRETWSRKVHKSSDCYGLLREGARKFAQIRPVNPRLFGLLRVRPSFNHG
jgi:hypothetical protein